MVPVISGWFSQTYVYSPDSVGLNFISESSEPLLNTIGIVNVFPEASWITKGCPEAAISKTSVSPSSIEIVGSLAFTKFPLASSPFITKFPVSAVTSIIRVSDSCSGSGSGSGSGSDNDSKTRM